MTSSIAFSLNAVRTLALVGLIVLGMSAAAPAEAATAQLSATPTNISAGQSTYVSWNCSGSVSAFLYTNEGSYAVGLIGNDTFSPTASFEYRVVCTDSTSSGGASAWVYVGDGACYTDWTSNVDGNAVYTVFDESNEVLDTYIIEGQGYDSSNYYQQCISACLSTDTKRCNLSVDRRPQSGEMGLIYMKCSLATPGTGTQSKPQVTQWNTSGDIIRETTYYNIAWSQSSGGTCNPVPPLPTVDLVATPTSISSGGTSKLTWTSTNADECSGVNFSTGNAVNNSSPGVNVNPTTTRDYTITCLNSAGTASDTVRVTVGSAPDLSAGAITPTTVTSGAAATLSSTISNTGSAGTGASFSVLFQTATSPTGANVVTLGTTSTATLAASSTRSVAYTTSTSAFPFAGSWYVRACADKRYAADANGQIVESKEDNNCGAWTPVTATAGTNYPNLTASKPLPNAATVGTAVTFSSTITNSSATTTGLTTQNRFDIDLDSDHTSITTTRSGSGSPVLAAGASNTTTASYTFSSATTAYVRVCADSSSRVLESNEGDNCSLWQTVTVTAPGGTEALTCSVNSTTIAVGGQVTWSASPSTYGSTAYWWTPSETGTELTNRPATLSRQYNAAGFYSMDVKLGTNGQESSCPTITVGNPCGTPSPSITANPDRVSTGGTSTITISATGINGSCTVSGPGVSQTISANSCTVADTQIVTPAITAQSVYTLSCTGATAVTAIVNVIPRFQEF